MAIMLGDLSLKQMGDRLGVKIPEPFRTKFDKKHQDKAKNIQVGEWHCFDIPFNLICGDIKIAQSFYGVMKEFASDVKEQLYVSIVDKNKGVKDDR